MELPLFFDAEDNLALSLIVSIFNFYVQRNNTEWKFVIGQ